jgi:hypothetical protein
MFQIKGEPRSLCYSSQTLSSLIPLSRPKWSEELSLESPCLPKDQIVQRILTGRETRFGIMPRVQAN